MPDQDIDSLNLEIYSSTKRAEDAIDRLIGKLNMLSSSLSFGNVSGLGDLANGISRLTRSMSEFKPSNMGKADFSNVAKSLSQLNKIDINSISNASIAIKTLTNSLGYLGTIAVDAQGIQNIAWSISQLGRKPVAQAVQNIPLVTAFLSQLVATMNNLGPVTFDVSGLESLASSISRLGGKAATNAIPNIQNLTSGLLQMMKALSDAPQISENLIKMTQAMAQLASQGGRVSSAVNVMQNGIASYGSMAASSAKFTRSLVSQLGFMAAKFYSVVRGAKGLWNSAESAMDYLETLNYFTQAFNQVADKADLSLWEDYGYASAKAYAESFEERARALSKKLTGFEIGGNGRLEKTSALSLGLDPEKTTQYQATFAQMASSMGVSSENALKLSNALTMIGADLASVRNLEFTEVWDDLASGMVGMSRTVDKYGVSIREADLQTQLFSLGIEAKVSTLTQADKALLRTIAILNNTQYAWADMSKTINSPANQLRLITSNLSALSKILGSLFLPIITKILPYINAFIIALQKMFSWIGNFAGIDLSSVSSSVGSAAVNMDDFSDSEEEATGNAKKLKKALSVLAFDELNQLNSSNDESGNGVGAADTGALDGLGVALDDALSRYQEAWNAAFSSMENRASELAEKIYNALEPVRKIIEDFKLGDYFQMGIDVSSLVVKITDFFTKAIKEVNWEKIGKNAGDFLAGIDWAKIFKSIGKLIWTAFNAAIDFYKGMFSEAPFETIILSMMAFPAILKSKLIKSLGKATTYALNFGKALSGNQTALATLTDQFPKTSKIVDTLRTAFSNFWFGLENGNFLTGLNMGLDAIRNSLTNLQKGVIGAVSVFAEFSLVKDGFYDILSGSENLISSIGQIGAAAGIASAALYIAFGPAGLVIGGITGVVSAISGINEAFDDIRAAEIGESIKNALSNPGGTPLSEVTAKFSEAIGEIGESFSVITEKSSGLEGADANIQNTWLEIEKIKTAMENGVTSVEEGTETLTRLFGDLQKAASEKFGLLEDTLIVAFGENGVLKDVYDRLGVSVEDTTSTIIQLNDEIEKKIEELVNEISTTDPSNPRYAEALEELAILTGQTAGLTQAISDYDFALSQIDYSKLLNDDGTLNADELKKFLDDIKTATETANVDIEKAIRELKDKLESEKSCAECLEDWVAADKIQIVLDTLPQAMDLLKQDISSKAAELTDTMQLDFIGSIEGVIGDAQKDWEEKGVWGQFWNGVFGAGTEDEYVKEAVDAQAQNIEQLSSAIETELGELGIDSAGWAKDAMDALYGSLFDSEYHFNDVTGGKTAYSLNEDFHKLITGATEGISALWEAEGKNGSDGYARGFNKGDIVSAVEDAISSGIEAGAERQESHSPSEAYKRLGEDAIMGYQIGISENTNLVTREIAEFIDSGLNLFKPVPEQMRLYGSQMMAALKNGISGNFNLVSSAMSSLANLVFSYKESFLSNGNNIGQWANYGISQGINSTIGNITGALNNVMNAISLYEGNMYNAGRALAQSLQNGLNSISVSAPSVSTGKRNSRILSEDEKPIMPVPFSAISLGLGEASIAPELKKFASYELGIGAAAQQIAVTQGISPYMAAVPGKGQNDVKHTGIDMSLLRDAIAQGFSLAMMDDSGRQQPISIHTIIQMPDGRVLADVVLDEFDRREDVRPGSIGRRLGIIN